LAIQNLLNKPADLSDIRTLEEAREEIKSLRLQAREFQYSLVEKDHDSPLDTGVADKKKQRNAVKDLKPKFKGGDDYKPIVIEKDEETRRMLLQVIKANILFHSFTDEEHQAIVDAFESVSYAKDTDVIKRGDAGDYFYVCDAGHLDVYKPQDGKMEKLLGVHIGHGQSFGELALMYNTSRAATLVAHTDTKLWRIHRDVYKEIAIHYKYVRQQRNVELIKKVKLHDKLLGEALRPEQLLQLALTFEREVFDDGEVIIRQGAVGVHCYIIESGSVGV